MALLEVSGVTKRYGGIIANQDVSLRVETGEIIGLIGPNGSGKTTLFGAIVGAHPIDEGRIRFDGREIQQLRVPQIARLGLLRTFQTTRVYKRMTCLENLQISPPLPGGRIRGLFGAVPRSVTVRALDLLAFVGLASKRDQAAGELSFGQQKLLEFAMALMNEPRLLLLDEPTAGINPTLINGLIDRLRRANAEFGVTLLVIEHNMRVMMNLAQRIYCLANGRILAEGAPETVRADPRVVDAYLGA